jgi:glutaredoxin
MMLATDERIRVFWAPGCTSCLRVKEFLTRLEIDYESVNAASSPEHVKEMARLGARSVPIVSRGDAFVYAQSLADVASFLGLEVEVDRQLSPHELVRRVNVILPAGQRYIKQIPDDVLDVRFRNSVRLLRGIAHHVFRIVEAFVEAMDTGVELTNELIMDATEAVRPGDDVLTYGSAVLVEFNAWWARYPDKSCQAQMDTYFGRQSVHDVLERTTWHSAQHVRQLLLVLDTLGIVPDGPLTPEDLAGLPLPEKVWEG